MRTTTSMSKGCVEAPVIAVGGQSTAKLAEVVQDCVWLPVGNSEPSTTVHFNSWNDLLQPWEVGCKTRYVIAFLDLSVTEGLISGLSQLASALHGVSVFAVAPFITAENKEAVLKFRPKFVAWQQTYGIKNFQLCGWRDGPLERSLVYALENHHGQEVLVRPSGVLTGLGVKMIGFMNTKYCVHIEKQLKDNRRNR